MLVAGVLSSLATAAAAAVITQPAWLPEWVPALSEAREPQAESDARDARPTRARKKQPARPQPPVAPPASVPAVEQATPQEQTVQRAPAHPRAARSASELFAAANAARREREPAAAVRGYRELLRAHPRSDEAHVARVALGRLLLDRLGDARGALREFDGYLQDPRRLPLREDALIGKALALQRLGRVRDEHSAWKALLAAYPASAYADRARTRVAALTATP